MSRVRAPRGDARPFLVVQTGTTLPSLRARIGDFPHWFRCGLGLAAHDVRLVRADAGDALPSADAVAGVVVTGSGAMVTDRLDWSERTGAWLADVVARGRTPLLGVCYGHQLLAHALGGTVDWNPQGREIGTKTLTTTAAAAADILFAPNAAGFRAHTTHQQSVVAPPPGAVVLAHSAQDPHQALRVGAHAWGVQFHPEFSAGAMAGYIRGRADRLREERIDPAQLMRECGPAPAARRILWRFAHYCRTLA
ncbi:MAG TPA: glutamine amidotransferase [Tahibacter sp.]|nr:glutamine amidotransferase [Tahibacter sp.]